MVSPLLELGNNDGTELVKKKVPYDASPKYIAEIAEVLTKGPKTGNKIAEELDYSEGLIHRNLRYGEELGFFAEVNEGFEITERGKTLGYMGLSESTEWLFKEVIREYGLYKDLIKRIFEHGMITPVRGEDAVSDEDIQTLFRNYNFDIGDRVLQGASRSFMRTLDAAGYASYKRGDGEYPTRIILQDEIDEFRPDTKRDEVDEDDSVGKVESEQDEAREEENHTLEATRTSANVNVNVNVEITENSDPEGLAEKVQKLRAKLEEDG